MKGLQNMMSQMQGMLAWNAKTAKIVQLNSIEL